VDFVNSVVARQSKNFGESPAKDRRYSVLPATITKIQQAFKEIKHMAIDTWEEEYRFAARRAMREVIETRMHNAIDAHLGQMRAAGLPDRRNGSFSSHLLTEVGDLELRIPRTRTPHGLRLTPYVISL
jgi:hypothetical protein